MHNGYDPNNFLSDSSARLGVTFSLRNAFTFQWSFDRAPATETVDWVFIPGRVKSQTRKIGITASLLDVQHRKRQFEASTVCGRQMEKWQLDSNTKKILVKATS